VKLTRYAIASLALLISTNIYPAAASLCSSSTSCTLVFTEGNTGSGFGSGNFGTLDLELSGNTVTINIDLADGFQLVNTGFPGSIGFVDSLGGGLSIGGFSSSLYSGSLSDASDDLHFDGFGYANDAAGSSGPHAGNGLNSFSFTVSGAGLSDVNELVNEFAGPAGQAPVYFVADVYNTNATGSGSGNTGLIAVTGRGSPVPVPEPSGLALFGTGLVALGLAARRRIAQLPVR
jgi:hypothetical protein